MAKNYMEALLGDLRKDVLTISSQTETDRRDEQLDDFVERTRKELIQSFKNGIMRGRELERNPKGRTAKSTGASA